jgi:hypothetical protein
MSWGFCARLIRWPADEFEVHPVIDNSGTRKLPLVKRSCARPPRFHAHFTSTSSWLNQFQRWFAALAERQIRRGTVGLEQAFRTYLDFYNRGVKPFV